jgi:hypothetical protein
MLAVDRGEEERPKISRLSSHLRKQKKQGKSNSRPAKEKKKNHQAVSAQSLNGPRAIHEYEFQEVRPTWRHVSASQVE